jgi:hypothetical protein
MCSPIAMRARWYGVLFSSRVSSRRELQIFDAQCGYDLRLAVDHRDMHDASESGVSPTAGDRRRPRRAAGADEMAHHLLPGRLLRMRPAFSYSPRHAARSRANSPSERRAAQPTPERNPKIHC